MKGIEFNISAIDKELQDKLQHKIDSKTKPVGSLGRLEELALQIGLIQQSLSPQLINPVLGVFAGDHGIAKDGMVNPYPQEVTAQMVRNLVQGGAAANVFCATHGITPKIIDAGVNDEFEASQNLISRKIAHGTANYLNEPAMSREQCVKAIRAGAELVGEWQRQGTNIVGFGEMGIGNTSSASIITSLIAGQLIRACTGKGTGLSENRVEQKAEILQQAIGKHNIENDPLIVLQTFGGFEIAMIVGGILQAAECGIVILNDGFIVTSALLLAYELYPSVLDYVIFAHESVENGHQIQLDYLGAKPILNLGMRLGEGTGAAMVYPVIESAVNFLNDMASFDDAGVSKGD